MRAAFVHPWPAAVDGAVIPFSFFALAGFELVHPHPHDLMQLDVNVWLAAHYARIPLFALVALAIVMLVRDLAGVAPAVCRVAMFVFATSYIAFDTATGIVTGLLVSTARASGSPDAWRAAIDAFWTHPVVGGALPLVAALGSVALSVGAVTAAIALRACGRSWPPLILLVVASFGIALFRTHAWPGGPLTFGGMGVASAWLIWETRHG